MRDIDYLLEQLHKDKPETQRIETDVNRIRLREEDVIAIVGVVEHGSPAHIAVSILSMNIQKLFGFFQSIQNLSRFSNFAF